MKANLARRISTSAYVVLALVAFLLAVYTHVSGTPSDKNVSTPPTDETLFTTSTNELYQWDSVRIGGGGFVTGLAIHPTAPDLIYARTDAGGLFRWNLDTQSWVQLLRADTLPKKVPLNVESVAVAPSNPDLVYTAVGANTKSKDKIKPGFLLKSTDGGNSWQILDLSLPMGGNEPWRWTGERLAVDPNNSNVVYFGSRLNGLWRSEDGGKTWSQVDSAEVPVGEAHPDVSQRAGVSYVTFDSSSGTVNNKTQNIYVGVAGKGTYRTTDAGETWQRLAGGPDEDLVPQQGAVDNSGELFATFYKRKKDSQGSVWKHTTAGWEEITPKSGKNYSAIALDPNKPKTLFVATYPMTPKTIYRSDDGGESWVALKNRLDKPSWYPDWSFYTLTGGIAVSPSYPGQVWLTNGFGVWRTEDGYGKQVKWSAAVEGIEETVSFDAISTPNGANLITAIADFDGFRHESLKSFPKQNHGQGIFNTTTSIAYSSGNPNFVASVGAPHHDPSKSRAGFSTNNARTWQNFASLEKGTHPKELIFGNIAVSATDTRNLVWQPSKWAPPYFTKDRGATWQKIAFFERKNIGGGAHTHLWNRQQALAADSVKGGTFYIYHHVKGRLVRTDDGGETWQIVNDTLPEGIWRGANVKSAPGMAGEVWVSLRGAGLYRSSNSGEDFVKIDEVDEAQVLGFGKAAPGVNNPTVFIQGEIAEEPGVFRSTDLGATWVKIADYPHGYFDTARVLVGDMNVFGRVYLGMSGNGFIYGQPIEKEGDGG